MKRFVLVAVLVVIVLAATAQPKTRDRVRRKFRMVEQSIVTQRQVAFRGLVRDVNKNPIEGACIEIEGWNRLVHTNEAGEFSLTALPDRRLRIRISCIGYQTKTIDYFLQTGFNDHYIALERNAFFPDPAVVTVQKREQHIQDVPARAFVIASPIAERYNIEDYQAVADFLPSVIYDNTGAGRGGFSMLGSNDAFDLAGIPSAVAVLSDDAPVIQAFGQIPFLYDFQRVEVLNGTQNVLFGPDAAYGAIHIINNKPEFAKLGSISVGGGSYGKMDLRGMLNIPVVKNKMAVRAAGIYHNTNGYVSNMQGDNLNGDRAFGGRLSMRFNPAFDHNINVSVNYLKHESSGVAFLNPWVQEQNEDSDLNRLATSLNVGDPPGSVLETMDVSLKYLYYINAHKYLSFNSIYRKSSGSGFTDADGTAMPAMELNDAIGANLSYNELRYNYSVNSRLNGSIGLNFRNESGSNHLFITSDDFYLNDIFNIQDGYTSSLGEVLSGISRIPVDLPQLYQVSADSHQESLMQEFSKRVAGAYIHFTLQIRLKWFITGGVSGFYNFHQLKQQSVFAGGMPSSFDVSGITAPNLLFQPAPWQETSSSAYYLTGQGGITYRLNEAFNLFGNVALGRKPQTLYFSRTSSPMKGDAEIINSYNGGWKWMFRQRLFWDGVIYYRKHENMQVIDLKHPPEPEWFLQGVNGVSYGAETGIKASLIKSVDLFGRYAYIHTGYDSIHVGGNDFVYSGHRFARSPEHSYTIGFNVHAYPVKGIHVTATPWYSRKSQYQFSETIVEGLDQPAHGLLNARLAVRLQEYNVTLNLYGTNLLDERFIRSAGHIGTFIGLPTVVPGPPRMLGAKITWDF